MTGHHFDEQITLTVGGNTTKFEDPGEFPAVSGGRVLSLLPT